MKGYVVIFEKGPTNWSAYVPDLPGCVAMAETREETARSIHEAIEFHIEGLQMDGESVPEPTTEAEYVGGRPIRLDDLRQRRNEILQIAAKHGASNVRVFGSVAKGTAGLQSDVDFLVDLEKGRSLLDHAALLVELQDLLESNVDVATESWLKERIRDRVLREAVAL